MAENDLNELERLRQELKGVTAERNRLLAENRFLIQASKGGQKLIHTGVEYSAIPLLKTDVSEDISRSSVNNESPLSDKIHLYRSLFHGREDVYAKFWQSRQSLKTGYSPVCIHEWDRIFCKKPEIRCTNCPNRELAPLTDKVIEDHLEGKITAGVYPLLEDDSCYFLAVDFDKHTWIEDCTAFLETCQITGIPAAIERSRSGNGGHIWIFFSEAVPASAARNLGCYLLTQAMSRRYQLGMDSYDRLFPNQDTVPKGGFGNLIALPFQKGPSEKGNSLFVDIDFKPFQDQWSFLASLERVKRSVLDEVVNEAVRTGQIIGIHLNSTDDEEQPWTTIPSRQMRETLPAGPWPGKVEIVLGNLIYIKKSGLTAPLLNKIKRLAAFQNPEYYKRQKMRLSTTLTPRVICCAEEFPQHMGIPRGCLDDY